MSSGTKFDWVDVDRALAAVAEAARARESTPFPLPVIEHLTRLLGADRAGYYEYDVGAGRNIFAVEQPLVETPWGNAEVSAAHASWPLRDPPVLRAPAVRKLSDALTRSDRRRNPFVAAFYRPLGVDDEIKLWLPAPVRRVRGFFFTREAGARDFSARERAMLELLGPHLALARERWEDRPLSDVLTAREGEIMVLVAEGLTNAQIAARLVLSTGTVRSHLDHIYAKLGVHTRTAAVTRFLGLIDEE